MGAMNKANGPARDYYDVLGISPEASTEDIKQAFRNLAKTYHPDVNKHDPSAQPRFAEASQAYEVLSDDFGRKAYDVRRATRTTSNADASSDADAQDDDLDHEIQGWYEDPYRHHQYRWFSVGRPTNVVSDDGKITYDDPPSEGFVGTLVEAPYTPRPHETTRVGDGTRPWIEVSN